MSDHVAYGLLVYTGLQIFVTMSALKVGQGSILPYFALIVLVVAIIPGCRMFEKRWESLSDSEAANPELADRFKRDRLLVWLFASRAAVRADRACSSAYEAPALCSPQLQQPRS
jgi:hypothetical protein